MWFQIVHVRINMKLLFFTIFQLLIFNAGSNDLKGKVEFKLHKVLDFIDKRYYQIHFDGLFGVTFAEAFLQKAVQFPLEENAKQQLIPLINKCRTIHKNLFPLLPNHPEYMITFRNKLLDATKWSKLLPDKFDFYKIKHLGHYTNWTSETIIKNKKAIYKGVKSDVCLREILELSLPNKYCHISTVCKEMMLDNRRIDSGYLLTHRLLYLQIVKLTGCKLPDQFWTISEYTQFYCTYVFKEATTSDLLGYPHHDIFLEQVVLCGMEGYAEFLNERWLNKMMEWQNEHGCYESIARNVTKRTSFIIDFGCSDHSTGLGAAALALHLWRYTYNTSQ